MNILFILSEQFAQVDRLLDFRAFRYLYVFLFSELHIPYRFALTVLQNVDFAVAMLGLDPGNIATIDDIRALVKGNITPGSLKITSLTLTEGKVVLTVDADVSYEVAGLPANKIYDITGSVKVKIYRKDTLLDAKWQFVKEVSSTFTKGEEKIEIPVSGIDFNSGFYKVEIEQ